MDQAAFVLLEYVDGVLKQKGQKTWDKINYKRQAMDLYKINQKYRMTKLCYDRSGVGDGAVEFYPKQLRLEEVVSTAQKKQEIINLVHSLFQNGKLSITDKKLHNQLLDQVRYISNAGNTLYRHPTGRHDDIFWALGYACYAARDHFLGIPRMRMSRSIRNTTPYRRKMDGDYDDSWTVHEM